MLYLHKEFFSLRKILFVKFSKSSQARDALLQILRVKNESDVLGQIWTYQLTFSPNTCVVSIPLTFVVHPVTMLIICTINAKTSGGSELGGWISSEKEKLFIVQSK